MRFLILLSVLWGIQAQAEVVYYDPVVQTAVHGDVKFSLITQKYKVIYSPKDYNIGNRTFAQYETKSLATLEDYAVVQFIRGCQFNTYVDDKGIIQYVNNIARKFFDGLVMFRHLDWVIDSTDKDAMFSNVTKEELSKWKTRHGWYFWNKKKNFEQDGEVYYGKEKPTHPSLYVMVYPGTSFIEKGWAKNISLEYKTCLYKTKDIPQETTPDDLSFAQAVQCFDWNSSFIYDHFNSKIDSPAGLHNNCLKVD